MQLNNAQKNYPVHEKELLAIVQALKKWRSDLLGGPIYVYTDHRTLEIFDTQKDLSRRQARWQELMSQFEMSITYIRGEDNTIADALSRLPAEALSEEEEHDGLDMPVWDNWMKVASCNTIMHVSADRSFLDAIQKGYQEDSFCKKLASTENSIKGINCEDGL
jgi:hypothetical protein